MVTNNLGKTPLNILWLDAQDLFNLFKSTYPTLGIIEFDLRFRIEMIFEKDLSPSDYLDGYKNPTKNFLEKVKELTAKIGEDQIDIIIVGNNLGSGLAKAEAINCTKMDFTIITYNEEVAEKRYRELGFSNFCKRVQLGNKLVKIAKLYQESLA